MVKARASEADAPPPDPARVEAQREALRNLPQDEYQILQDICESNGINEEQLVHRADEVSTIEMFLFNFGKMCCLNFFQNLTTVCIMQQNVDKIASLESCKSLENVWIAETQVDKIQGLENNLNIKNLYLYSNKIKRIENLSHLTKLERIWLCDNEIPRIEGLERLSSLTELNIARNKVERVGDIFKMNPKLTSLNLSDNGIGSFKEVSYLARLPSLTDLSLSDPHWGENPITSLCNYQTYVLFNIQQLTSLDTLVLADETKQLAEATYMKKKMYYNMRIKTLRRNTTNALRRAQEGSALKIDRANQILNTLTRSCKGVEREIEEAEFYGGEQSAETGEALKKKFELLAAAVKRKTRETADMEQHFQDSKQRVYEMGDQYVRRLLVELETGGNIRMEDGRPTDLWYKSCVDLLHSRFFKEDFADHRVAGLRVVQVTRIHNRFLRNRFEEHLESMVDVSDPTYKRSLEYLFFGECPMMAGELQRVPEDGFRHPHEYAALTGEGAVALSNSVSLSDLPRMQMRLDQQKAAGISPKAGQKQWATGQVLVTKVFLGKSVQEMNVLQAKRAMEDAKGGPNLPPCGPKGEAIRILPEVYPEHNSVFRMKATDPKQRLWYVFDHALVLPEYLVEFEYEIKPLATDALIPTEMQIPLTDPRSMAELEKLEFDIRPISRPIVPYLIVMAEESAKGETSKETLEEGALEWTPPEADPTTGQITSFRWGSGASVDPREKPYLEAVNMAPMVEARPRVYVMTEELVLKQTNQIDLKTITYLNLHGNSLRRLEALAPLVNLKVLVASFNEISKVEGVADLKKLERLELGYNAIKRIEGLRGLDKLTHLELNNNQIYRLEDINVLKKYTAKLHILNLRHNQICDNKTYKGLVLRRLTCLSWLDGTMVTAEDHRAAAENSSTLTVQLIKDNSFCQRRTMWSIAGMGQRAGEKVKAGGDDDAWWESVEELVLEHQRVRRLQNLERLTKMRRASFADNELTRVEGLEFCTGLEELSLEDNRITQVEGLNTLTNLKMLDLGKNKIATIANLDALTWLTQLSIEDNEIENLQGLNQLSCLMELYIGNNNICEMREVQQLRDLPKLIILDLLGNPLCQSLDYRLYVVYHLRKLKVLDGMGIEASEQAAAKSKYAGKLTLDFLEERVGHRFFEHLRELDLSGFRIRDLGKVFYADDFHALRELNLDNNFVSDISSLACLTNLCALRLNHNRMEGNPIYKEDELKEVLAEKGDIIVAGTKLPCFNSLEVLQLGHCGIATLASLQLHRLRYSLKILFLQDNDLTKLDGLDSLVNLQELVLDRNKIKFLDPSSLQGLAHLQELRIEENGLRSMSNLHPLWHLKCLHLGMNRIVEVAEIEKLAVHTELMEITLSNNPVARKQVYRPMLVKKIPSLRVIDGREVTMEERDHVEMLFAPSEVMQQTQYVTAPQPPQYMSGLGKVPIKLTSMNFESLIVPQHAAPAIGSTLSSNIGTNFEPPDLLRSRSLRGGSGGAINNLGPSGPSVVGMPGRPGSGTGAGGSARPTSNEAAIGQSKFSYAATHGAAGASGTGLASQQRTRSMLRSYYRHSGT